MDALMKKVVKRKKLQRLGAAKVILIPKLWTNSLNWDQDTKLILEFHPVDRKIILSEDKIPKEEGESDEEEAETISELTSNIPEENEEAGDTVLV